MEYDDNWQQQARKLLKPEEVMALSPSTAITFAPGRAADLHPAYSLLRTAARPFWRRRQMRGLRATYLRGDHAGHRGLRKKLAQRIYNTKFGASAACAGRSERAISTGRRDICDS